MVDNVLDSYLIALGFKVDSNSQAKAEAAIARFAASVTTLAASVAATSLAVTAGVARIASEMEGLFYAGQRINASVENIKALSFAVGQVGGTAAGARSALENIASFIRSNPGGEGFFRRLGVQTRDASGGLRDTTELLHDFAATLKTMPYYRAKSFASVVGLDENTMQALFRGTSQAEAAIHRMYALAGLDADQAAKGATVFMGQMRLFGAALGILQDSIASRLQGGIGNEVDRLRDRLVLNFGRITDVIEWCAKAVLSVADSMVTLGLQGADIAEQIYDWWIHIDKGTRQWIEGIGLAELALRSLSTGILATPLGKVVAVGVAIAALVKDYNTWRSGGQSLIDWKQWSGEIDQAIAAFHRLEDSWDHLWPQMKVSATPFLTWFAHQFAGAIRDTIADLADVMDATSAAMSGDWKTVRAKIASVSARETASMQGPEIQNPDAKPEFLVTGGGPLSGAQRAQNEKIAFGAFKAMGLNDKQAAAFVGSAIGESGLNPNAVGDYVNGVPTAGGIFQWHPDRRDAILKATGIDVWHDSLQNQLKGAAWELDHTHEKAFFKVMGDPTTGQGVADVTNSYLMPKDRAGAIATRTALASDVLSRQVLPQTIPASASGAASAAPGPVLNTSIVVNGSGDPRAVAAHVADQQKAVAASLVRNMAPLIR